MLFQANWKIQAAKLAYEIYSLSQRLRYTTFRSENEEKVCFFYIRTNRMMKYLFNFKAEGTSWEGGPDTQRKDFCSENSNLDNNKRCSDVKDWGPRRQKKYRKGELARWQIQKYLSSNIRFAEIAKYNFKFLFLIRKIPGKVVFPYHEAHSSRDPQISTISSKWNPRLTKELTAFKSDFGCIHPKWTVSVCLNVL